MALVSGPWVSHAASRTKPRRATSAKPVSTGAVRRSHRVRRDIGFTLTR